MKVFEFVKSNYYMIILHLVVIMLAGEVYILSARMKELKAEYAGATIQIKEGDLMNLHDLLKYGSNEPPDTTQRMNVFVFTTTCPFCKQNIPQWNSIDSIGKLQASFQSIGICMDPDGNIESFKEKYKPTFPIYLPKNLMNFQKANHLGAVPQTIIREKGGKVLKVLPGPIKTKEIPGIVSAISENNQ
jgi:hypothetical protein